MSILSEEGQRIIDGDKEKEKRRMEAMEKRVETQRGSGKEEESRREGERT